MEPAKHAAAFGLEVLSMPCAPKHNQATKRILFDQLAPAVHRRASRQGGPRLRPWLVQEWLC